MTDEERKLLDKLFKDANTRLDAIEARLSELDGANAAIGDLKAQVQDILRRLKREAIG